MEIIVPKFRGIEISGSVDMWCCDPDGNEFWRLEGDKSNIVVNVGLQELLSVTLDAGSASSQWWLCPIDGLGVTPTIAPADTLAVHGGWTDGISKLSPPNLRKEYSGTVGPAAVSGNSITNSGTPVVFTAGATFQVGGVYLADASSGTAGKLFSAKGIDGPAQPTVNANDTINATYTINITTS